MTLAPQSAVASIGNFDGIHLGHQALIHTMLARAKAKNLRSVLILFEPYPREFFSKTDPPFRIQTLTAKLLKLKQWPIDAIHLIHFNAAVAAQSPAEFITQTLQHLQVSELVIGHDFRFGKDRCGSRIDLENAGINTIEVAPVLHHNQRVSSSRIREELQRGDFSTAAALLGEPYTFTGRVIHGAKQGRVLGFPTLNLALRKKMPLSGVYEVWVDGLDSRKKGVANIGRRPSLNPLAHPLLEVYVLDYAGDAYGRRIKVEFIRKIRDEKKFDSLVALKAQIAADILDVKEGMV